MENIDAIRHQRQLCNDAIAGFLHHGMRLSDAEHEFVLKCSAALRPLPEYTLMVLQKISDRRSKRPTVD